MTREEKKNALHCLKVMIDEEVCEECDLYGTTGADHCEADCVRVAIKALEQEPCEDAISRQAAIEAVINLCKHYTPIKSVNHPHMDFVIEVLQELPPINPQPKTDSWSIKDVADTFKKHGLIVEQEPKTGHWIKTGYIDKVMCSICNHKMWNYWEVNDFVNCPHCGAKMVDPHESEGTE